ncbi:MAG: ABC transporter permease [Anaerolineae bacterium]|nr:ABC transporter permease [Anaerolineae bacterium]
MSISIHASSTSESLPQASFTAAPSRSLWQDAGRRLWRNKAAVASLCFIVALVAIALLAPWIAPYPYDKVDFDAITEPPSPAHWLGTDSLGRDVLSRLMYGARVSLSVSIVAQIVILLIGVPIGLISAYYGGWVDTLIQRAIDILYAFPSLLFIIVVVTYLKAVLKSGTDPVMMSLSSINQATGGLMGIFIALALVFWLTVSRLVRGQVLSLKAKEFIEAAYAVGVPNHRVILRHILPNTLAPIIIAATFAIPIAITLEAGLSFLGLGVVPPVPSWGMMIAEGITNIRSYPHLLLASGTVLSLTLLAFNFLGDGLRDAFDPSARL